MTSAYDSSNDDGSSRTYSDGNVTWMLLWICTMLLFICLPFFSSRRRTICMRGIRERRWISDDENLFDDDGNNHSDELDQQERRQQIQDNHRRFRTNRTQEDEIRQQYLVHLMENYSMSLTKSDVICEDEGNAASEKSKMIGKKESQDDEEEGDDTETQCESTIDSTVIESRDSIDNDDNSIYDIEAQTIAEEKRSDSSDDDEGLLAFKFTDDQKASIPLSGTSVVIQDTESKEESTSGSRRLVSNGCAICLCLFEEDDKITWSSNSKCTHVYHSDCILNWYLAVGRKAQKQRKRDNRNMSDEQALSLICDFPILCPCCRQDFCIETSVSKKDEENGSGE